MNIIYLPQREPSPIYKELGTVMRCPPGRKLETIQGAGAVLVTGLEPVTRELIEASPALKMVASLTTGTDHIDKEALRERGIPLVTLLDCPGYVKISGTAEHAFGLMLALARDYPRAFTAKERVWGNELQGKRLGIVGFGRIGEMLAGYADAFGMEIQTYDIKDPRYYYRPGSYDSLEELVSRPLDFLAICCNLTPESEAMIGVHELRSAGPVFLVNTSRPQIIAPGALQIAFNSGFLRGYACDFNTPENDRLRKLGYNVITTPHIGGATFEGNNKADELIAAKLKEILHESKTTQEKQEGFRGSTKADDWRDTRGTAGSA